MSDEKIKVSVTLLAYKHAQYIRQCLDSILSQKVNFRYEIIIGDDCSEDGTAEILMEYKEKYPEIVKPIINEVNVGASKNSYRLKQICCGEYIVGAESDDYWVDDGIFQKQVDYLDNHSNIIAVGTNFYNVEPDGSNPYISMLRWQVNKKYSLKDYIKYGMVIHGNTIMYRNVLPVAGERYEKLRFTAPTMGDVISRVLLYDRGYIFCLPDVSYAHRMGAQEKTSFYSAQRTKAIDLSYMFIDVIHALDDYFEGKYNLEKLIANRTGAVILNSVVGNYRYESDAFKRYIKSLPRSIRLLSYERFLQKGARAIAHKIGRKLNLFYNKI